MSFARGIDGSAPVPERASARVDAALHEERRATRGDRLGAGTLACARCDAPVAIGSVPRAPTEPLSCPFCGHEGAVRDFLSLAGPPRPARVVITVSRP